MNFRQPAIKSKKLRDSAKDEPCTFQIPDHCNGNPETTVLCHLQFDGGIMGGKTDDLSAAYGCSGCHAAIDQRLLESDSARQFYMVRALVRTQRRMVAKGLLKVAA